MYSFPPIQGTRSKKMENYRTNMSPTFNQDQDLVPWIGGQLYIEMLNLYFSNIPDICGYVEKLSEQHFNVWMCSNPGDNIFIAVNSNEARISEWNVFIINISTLM